LQLASTKCITFSYFFFINVGVRVNFTHLD
jgi:hypothetical protein